VGGIADCVRLIRSQPIEAGRAVQKLHAVQHHRNAVALCVLKHAGAEAAHRPDLGNEGMCHRELGRRVR
jgi:hypothetical protein